MEIQFEPCGINWIKTIDFDRESLGTRNERLQCRVFAVPELGWVVYTLLSPMNSGLWLLRLYEQFEAGLRDVFFVQKDGVPDDDRAGQFEAMLKKHKVPKRSLMAYYCFGLYPQLWGHRFSPRSLSSHVARRLLSVAVPEGKAGSLEAYFRQQIMDFGSRVTAPAHESQVLYISRPMSCPDPDPSGRLLLDLASRMDDAGRAEVISRLHELLESEDARERFERSLEPGMKFSGAFRAPDRRDILPDRASDCIEIAKLRVNLMCKLRWPHALEFILQGMNDTPDGDFAELAPEIKSVLASFPSVGTNPLTLAA